MYNIYLEKISFYEVDTRQIEFIIGCMPAKIVRKNMFTNKL